MVTGASLLYALADRPLNPLTARTRKQYCVLAERPVTEYEAVSLGAWPTRAKAPHVPATAEARSIS